MDFCIITKEVPVDEISPGNDKKDAMFPDIYLCNKVTDAERERSFYPDLIFPHPFMECEVTDLELAAQYKERLRQGGSHQTMVLVRPQTALRQSGQGESPNQSEQGEAQDQSEQKKSTKQSSDHSLEQAKNILAICLKQEFSEPRKNFSEPDFTQLCEEFSCSQTMAEQLRQYLCYGAAADIDSCKILEFMREEGRLPVPNKREGVKQLAYFKQQLIG